MTRYEARLLVWNYHLMGQTPARADFIWALGSHDVRVADRVAELWHDGLAPLIVMSGGLGNFTKGVFSRPEAEIFADRAIGLGVPEEVILIENQSTNTGENVSFTKRLLEEAGIEVSKTIAVQKPYMERRSFATISKQWPNLQVSVTSPQLSMSEYCGEVISLDELTHIMVGDLQRILEYPKRGFMTEQIVPDQVVEAWEFLVEAGYRNHLISSVTS